MIVCIRILYVYVYSIYSDTGKNDILYKTMHNVAISRKCQYKLNIFLDVDGFDDGDGQLLRDSLNR